MRKTTITIKETIINGVEVVIGENGVPAINQLEPLTVQGTINEYRAKPALQRHYKEQKIDATFTGVEHVNVKVEVDIDELMKIGTVVEDVKDEEVEDVEDEQVE